MADHSSSMQIVSECHASLQPPQRPVAGNDQLTIRISTEYYYLSNPSFESASIAKIAPVPMASTSSNRYVPDVGIDTRCNEAALSIKASRRSTLSHSPSVLSALLTNTQRMTTPFCDDCIKLVKHEGTPLGLYAFNSWYCSRFWTGD